MNINELVALYEAHRNCQKLDPKAHAMRVVVRALRDEIDAIWTSDDMGCGTILDVFNEILGDAGNEKVAGSTPEGAVLSSSAEGEPPASPATDAAPAVCEITAERDRLKAALEALEAVRSDLPEKVSEQWLYEGVRHWHRNCDWDDPRDGWPLDRGDGATVAKILNMIPRKALGDAS